MNSQTFNSTVQVITAIAIVIGLGLVIWELRQAREATQSQLSSDAFTIMSDLSTALLGEHPTDVLAKACDAPDTMTRAELILLDQYYFQILSRLMRMRTLSQRGSFYSEDYWRDSLSVLVLLFETHAGRAYWKTSADYVGPEIKAAGDQYLSTWKEQSCTELYDEWMQGIKESMSEN